MHLLFPFHLWIATSVVALVLALAPVATAAPLEGQVWVGAGLANAHSAAPTPAGWWGPGLSAGGVLQLSDFWRLTLDTAGSYHFARTIGEEDELIGPHRILTIAAGVRYAFDVFKYIPYAGLSAVFQPLAPPTSAQTPGGPLALRATLGLDYRIERRYSVGAAIEVGAPVMTPSDFPHYSGIRVHFAYHFRRF
jgi:hypothetical protein